MYIAAHEIQNMLYKYNAPGATLRIIEFYPQLQNNDTRLPVNEDNLVHYCLMDTYNRNIYMIQNGQIKLVKGAMNVNVDIDAYKASLDNLLSYIRSMYPQLNIVVDDVEKMYKIWRQMTSTYNIAGLINITSYTTDMVISDLRNIWIPEFDIGAVLKKNQFIAAIQRFVPEFCNTVIVNDALYEYAKTYLMNVNTNSVFDAQYNIENMTNYVSMLLPNIKKEELLNIIESPLDTNLLHEYYSNMMRNGFDYNAAKAMLAYHKLVFAETYNKVRDSFGIANIDTNFYFTLPTSMYLQTRSSLLNENVVSII